MQVNLCLHWSCHKIIFFLEAGLSWHMDKLIWAFGVHLGFKGCLLVIQLRLFILFQTSLISMFEPTTSVLQMQMPDCFHKSGILYLYYTPGIGSMPKGYIVFISSISLFICPSVRPFVCPSHSITNYFEVFLITYNSAATDQNFSYLVWGYLGGFSSILHLWTPGSCPRVGLEVKI